MRQLTINEVTEVSGGTVSEDTAYGGSLGASVAFLGVALALSNPVGIGIFLGASILSSGLAIYYAAEE